MIDWYMRTRDMSPYGYLSPPVSPLYGEPPHKAWIHNAWQMTRKEDWAKIAVDKICLTLTSDLSPGKGGKIRSGVSPYFLTTQLFPV